MKDDPPDRSVQQEARVDAKGIVGSVIAVALVLSGGAAASGGTVESGGSLVVSPETVSPGEFTTASNAVGSECVGETAAQPTFTG